MNHNLQVGEAVSLSVKDVSWHELLRKFLSTVIRRRMIVIGLISAITVLLGWKASGLILDNNRELWLPRGNPYVETTRVIHDIFGGRNIVVIGVQPKNGDIYQPVVIEKIDRIQRAIGRVPEAVDHNITGLTAKKVKSIKGDEEGMEVRRMVTLPLTPEHIRQLKKDVADNPFYLKTLVSENGLAAAIVADFKMQKENPTFADLNDAIKQAILPEIDDSVTVHLGGVPVQYAEVEHYTATAGGYFGAAFVIIMLIQYWSFRSFQGMFLPMLTGLLSVVWGLGIFGVLGINLDVLNTVTPILIMAVTSGHAIQILKRYYEEYRRKSETNPNNLSAKALSTEAIIDSLILVGPIMMIAGIIAAVTFFSLTTAPIVMVSHFGLLAGCGILSSLILEMTLIPAVRSLLPPPVIKSGTNPNTKPSIIDKALTKLSDSVALGKAPVILAVGMLMVILVGTGIARLQVDNSTMRYLSPENHVRSDDAMLNSTFGGTNTLFFLVEGTGRDSIKNPEVLKGIDTLQHVLNQEPVVGKTQSFTDLIKQMHQAMHEDNPQYYAIPDTQDMVAQYLLLYSMSGDPQDFDNLVDNEYQKALIWVFLKDDSTANAKALYERVKPVIANAFPPGVTINIGGSLPEAIAMNDVVVQEKITNTCEMMAVIFVLACLMFRSLVGGIFVIIPVLFIVLSNFGSMGWLGIPLDMGTATTASMAIGIGADYEIYLLYRFREELMRTRNLLEATRASLLTSGKAVLFVACSIAGGYAMLLTSDFGFYHQLAFAVITTMLISAVCALLLLRSMIVVFKPNFIFKGIA
jgi:predicted RND superfamily exporter protein